MGELGLTEIGAIGVFSVFVIKELFALIRSLINKNDESKENDSDKTLEALERIVVHWAQVVAQVDETHRKTNALFDWHNVKDSKGLPIWYSNLQATEDLKEIKQAFAIQGRLLDSIHDKQMYFEREIKK